MGPVLSLKQVAKKLGVTSFRIRRLFDLNELDGDICPLLSNGPGEIRIIPVSYIPVVKAKLAASLRKKAQELERRAKEFAK